MLRELCARLKQATVLLLSTQVFLRAFSSDLDLSRVVSKHMCMHTPLLCGPTSGAGTRGLWWDELFGTAVGSEKR